MNDAQASQQIESSVQAPGFTGLPNNRWRGGGFVGRGVNRVVGVPHDAEDVLRFMHDGTDEETNKGNSEDSVCGEFCDSQRVECEHPNTGTKLELGVCPKANPCYPGCSQTCDEVPEAAHCSDAVGFLMPPDLREETRVCGEKCNLRDESTVCEYNGRVGTSDSCSGGHDCFPGCSSTCEDAPDAAHCAGNTLIAASLTEAVTTSADNGQLSGKWFDGLVVDDRFLIGNPWNAQVVLVYDVVRRTAYHSPPLCSKTSNSDCKRERKYVGSVLAGDAVYFLPSSAMWVLRYGPDPDVVVEAPNENDNDNGAGGGGGNDTDGTELEEEPDNNGNTNDGNGNNGNSSSSNSDNSTDGNGFGGTSESSGATGVGRSVNNIAAMVHSILVLSSISLLVCF